MGSQAQTPDNDHICQKGLEKGGVGLSEGILQSDKNERQAVRKVGDPVALIDDGNDKEEGVDDQGGSEGD